MNDCPSNYAKLTWLSKSSYPPNPLIFYLFISFFFTHNERLKPKIVFKIKKIIFKNIWIIFKKYLWFSKTPLTKIIEK